MIALWPQNAGLLSCCRDTETVLITSAGGSMPRTEVLWRKDGEIAVLDVDDYRGHPACVGWSGPESRDQQRTDPSRHLSAQSANRFLSINKIRLVGCSRQPQVSRP